MDNRKIILAFYVVSSMVVWLISRSAIQYIYLQFYQVRRLPGIGAAREVLPVVLAVIGFIVVLRHARANLFMDEVVTELKKVTWPSREDTARSTTVVIICILVASVILATFDLVWESSSAFFFRLNIRKF